MESLESIHAARMRSHSEAGPSTQTAAKPAAANAAAEDANEETNMTAQYGVGEQDEESDPYSLPVSHEVALEGATCLKHNAAWKVTPMNKTS